MRPKIVIGLLIVAAILVGTGVAGAQTATPGPQVQLPSGETVWDLNGDWKALVENYGAKARWVYPNLFRITQTGRDFSAIRLKDNPPPSPGNAGSPSLFGELDATGFKYIFAIDSGGSPWRSVWQISEDGNKMLVDERTKFRSTMTRMRR